MARMTPHEVAQYLATPDGYTSSLCLIAGLSDRSGAFVGFQIVDEDGVQLGAYTVKSHRALAIGLLVCGLALRAMTYAAEAALSRIFTRLTGGTP